MNAKAPLSVDVDYLRRFLEGDRASVREKGREFAAHSALRLKPEWSLERKRQATLEGVVALANAGFTQLAMPTHMGGPEDYASYVAGFEELVLAEPSIQVKAGVQYGLFSGAIHHLGNKEQHARWLKDALEGKLLGSFAMTEIGHGSDVANVDTTATYDPKQQEFVIHTPHRQAVKEYIGNAAAHAQAAVVFARLITSGIDYGVHAFFVPVRSDEGRPLPGVTIEDDGYKGGLAGVDNGRFGFDQVRIPRENLLDRYGHVAEDGEYSSPIHSPGKRFFTMLGTLVMGRVSLDGASTVASKLALDIALRYAVHRKQFEGGVPGESVHLMDYGEHQRRLMPLVAKAWANSVAHENLLDTFDEVFSSEAPPEATRQLLESQAAGFKAVSTWDALDTIQECREACGGAGFMWDNRLVGLRHDLDVYVTFEGDNTVLLQLVGKRLLQDYSRELKDIDFGGAARYLSHQAAEHSLYRSGIASMGRTISDLFTPALASKRVRSGQLQEALLSSRVDSMLSDLAQKLRPATKMDRQAAADLFNNHQHQLIQTAEAYIHLLKWKALTARLRAIDTTEHPDEAKMLRRIRDLYGLTLIHEHIGWHVMYGRLSMARARMVGPTIGRLCRKLAQNAQDLADMFGFTSEHRRTQISEGQEAARQNEATAHARQARSRTDYPIDERIIRAKKKKP